MYLFHKLLNYLGSAVCHQVSERCLVYKNLALPLCARCTGFYFSFLISFIFYLIVNRKHRDLILRHYIIVVIISIILMGIEVLIEIFNLLSLTNQVRLFTGILVGSFFGLISSIAFFRISNLNSKVKENTNSTYFFIFSLILPIVDFITINYLFIKFIKLFFLLATFLIISEILFFSLIIYLFIQSVLPKLIINRKIISLSRKIFIAVVISISLLLTLAFLRSHLSPLLKIF